MNVDLQEKKTKTSVSDTVTRANTHKKLNTFGFCSSVPLALVSHMFQTQKGSRRFKRIENRNGVFALLVSYLEKQMPFPSKIILNNK